MTSEHNFLLRWYAMKRENISKKTHNNLYVFATSKAGATAIEYALIAGLIAVVLILSLTSIGQEISNQFLGTIASALSGGA